MVSITSFKSSSTEHDVQFVKYGTMLHKIDDEAEIWCGYHEFATDEME